MEAKGHSQEEYIWAMRESVYKELYDTGQMRRPSESSRKRGGFSTQEENQTKVMASLVPDEVIFNIHDYSQRQYDCCLFFGDVSGFTELAERYSKTGDAGPSRLTSVLNKYLGTMVQEIMSYGGDILKFSGDAFLAWWKVTENEPMRDAVHECLDCALVIQKQYGTLLTDVGVTIRVKLAVSAGHVIFSLIGDDQNSHYIIIGKPIWDVKAGEAKSTAGDIIVSPPAWRYTNANEYIGEEMSDGIHMKVLGIGPNWRSVQKGDRAQRVGIGSGEKLSTDEEDSSGTSDNGSTVDDRMNDQFVLRPAVNIATRLNIKQQMRKFIILPVMKSIDMNEPFEYLTEMRQVVIMFINIVSRKLSLKDYVQLGDESYRIVCQVVKEKHGCVNKVSLFDKDLMMVVVFGLRGLKHELECQLALRAAAECYQKISSLTKVYSVSIGVTTGKTYCGIVGHTLRREYTVISLTVNKAARLMVNYKDRVSCDRETFLHSKMEARNFILQEYKKLKGISHPGPVYEFKEMFVSHDMNKISSFPLLGRDDEVKLYLKLLKDYLSPSSDNVEQESKPYKMLLIKGEARLGKTRLLEELIYCTPPHVPVNRVTFIKKDSSIPYWTIRLIFCTPLGITKESSVKEKEAKLRVCLRKMNVPELLCVLNEVFAVHFKITPLYSSLDEKHKKAALRKMIRQICYGCFLTKWVFVLDNIDFMDDESWALFNVLLDAKMLFIVATLGQSTTPKPYYEESDDRLKVIHLKGINKWYHGGVTCQIMDVKAIPPELENGRKKFFIFDLSASVMSTIINGQALVMLVNFFSCTYGKKRQIIKRGAHVQVIQFVVRMLETTSSKEYRKVDDDEECLNIFRAIQTRSNGNPGWIESFLISVIQDNGLYVLTTDVRHMNDLGLIIPPLYMMNRLTPEEALEWKQLMEEKSKMAPDGKDDNWKKYIDICREDYLNVEVGENVESKLLTQNVVTICLCSSKFNVDDIDPELSLEFIILKTFDSLSSYEQLFVKCSSILGNQFLREVLTYVMSAPNDREMALAVRKLFEIKVLTCAKADFLESGNMIFQPNLDLPDAEEGPLKCHCRGIKIQDCCSDLPRYASCGYMQYRNDRFRSIAYNLLTDSQRKEFHSKAIRYLEKETRKCRSCGSGFFETILGDKTDEGFITLKGKKKRRLSGTTYGYSDQFSISQDRRLSLPDSGSQLHTLRSTDKRDSASLGESSIIIAEKTDKTMFTSRFGYNIIRKLKNSFSLTKAFSKEDFTDCQCNTILAATYSQLINHCKGAAKWSKAIEANILYAEICITTYNAIHAIGLLHDTLLIIRSQSKHAVDTNWQEAIIKAKIRTRLGCSYMELGHYDKATVQFHKALMLHGCHFPKDRCPKKMRIFHHVTKHLFGMYVLPSSLTKQSLTNWETVCCNDIAENLCHLSDLYMLRFFHKEAQLAAAWSLSKALQAGNNFRIICMAYANSITMAHHFKRTNYSMALEVHSLRLCHMKFRNIEVEELKVVAKLYTIIFRCRFFRTNVDKCIHIGYIVLRIGTSVQAQKIILPILPLLVRSLMMGKHFSNALSILQEIDYFAVEVSHNIAKVWYYAISLTFHLETGYCVASFEQCMQFGNVECVDMPNSSPKKRFYACMWLWCIRNERWEEAELWEYQVNKLDAAKEWQSLSSKFTALVILEGLIINLVHKMDMHHISEKIRLEKQIESLISNLEEESYLTQMLQSRFYHLKAYYRLVRYNDRKVFVYLKKAKKFADTFGNATDESWIEHTKKAWMGQLPVAKMNAWKFHCDVDNILDYQDLETNNDCLVHYTLPSPMYL